MGFVEGLSYETLSQLTNCSAGALRQRVWRYKITKAQVLAECSGLSQDEIASVTSVEQLEELFKTKTTMERRFVRSPFSNNTLVTRERETGETLVTEDEKNDDFVTSETELETKLHKDNQQTGGGVTGSVTTKDSDLFTETQPQRSKVSQLEDRLKEPAAEVVTFIKSDILSVTAMLILSVLIAVSFTAKIFMASGVSPLASFIMSVLLDFTMIVFVFRGHTSIAWLFGVNIFFQVALTTSAKMFVNWMPESTIIGIKGLLVAISIVIAIKGLSDYVQKNFK